MGIRANLLYRGITVGGLYFRLTKIALSHGQWTALLCGYKDREAAHVSASQTPPSPAFSLAIEAPYVEGVAPYAALYTATHDHEDLSDVVDLLDDPPLDDAVVVDNTA